MKEDKAMQLYEALTSGKYKQSHHLLRDGKGYCCLGVACDISKIGTWKEVYADDDEVDDEDRMKSYTTTLDSGAVIACEYELPFDVKADFGFFDILGARRDGVPVEINGASYDSLSVANDKGVTFKDIALYIQQNWKDL